MMVRVALRALPWCLTALVAAAAAVESADDWICVPGDSGRWRCGQGQAAPPTSPLPELTAPPRAGPDSGAGDATPRQPSIFILDRPTSRASPLQLPVVEPQSGRSDFPAPGAFALKIASVSEVDDIPAFVDSYGLDPNLVRHVEIDEAGVTRQVILWGAFSSREQARRAIAGLPGVVRAVRPQIVRADEFNNPPRPLRRALAAAPTRQPTESGVATATAAAPAKPQPHTRIESTAAASPADDPGSVRPSAGSIEAPPPTVAAPTAKIAAAPAPAAVPAGDPVEAPPPARAQPARMLVATPKTDVPGNSVDPEKAPTPPKPVTRIVAAPEAGTPDAANLRAAPAADRPRTPPSHGPTTGRARPATPAAALPAAASRPPPTDAAPAARPGPGAAAFLELPGGAYTVQLTSLADAAWIDRYLGRHRLDPERVYRVQVDEGVGPRWLLLWDWYHSLDAAEAARGKLPDSVRSPWVRRIQPLQQRLGKLQ